MIEFILRLTDRKYKRQMEFLEGQQRLLAERKFDELLSCGQQYVSKYGTF